jgi:hypothetical protein
MAKMWPTVCYVTLSVSVKISGDVVSSWKCFRSGDAWCTDWSVVQLCGCNCNIFYDDGRPEDDQDRS